MLMLILIMLFDVDIRAKPRDMIGGPVSTELSAQELRQLSNLSSSSSLDAASKRWAFRSCWAVWLNRNEAEE